MLDIFKEPFMLAALAGGVITAALGIAAGMFAGIDPLLGAFILTITAIVIFWIPFSERTVSRNALLGFVYAFCAAISVIFIAKNPLADAKGLNLISGNLLYITLFDLKVLGSAALFVGLAHLLFFKEFMFVSFDRETAYTAGVKASLFDFLLYLTIGVMISLSMRISGVVFVFSSLVIPAMCGVMVMKTVRGIFFLSVFIALVSVISGIWFSYIFDLPSGPAVTAVYAAVFLFSATLRNIFKK